MKTDRVLTMDECFNEWGAVPMHVDPPTCDARHIPIAEETDAGLRRNGCSCNCDRWGHPLPDRALKSQAVVMHTQITTPRASEPNEPSPMCDFYEVASHGTPTRRG